MDANKTLIAYDTKGGVTEETAQKVAETLRSKYHLEVDLVDLRKQKVPSLDSYRNIIVGSGVRVGKVYDKALKFLESHFGDKPVAFYVCSGDAGNPESYEKAKIKYVENVLVKYPDVKLIAVEAFGGRMKVLGKTVFDNIDMSKVEAWAEELGRKFIT